MIEAVTANTEVRHHHAAIGNSTKRSADLQSFEAGHSSTVQTTMSSKSGKLKGVRTTTTGDVHTGMQSAVVSEEHEVVPRTGRDAAGITVTIADDPDVLGLATRRNVDRAAGSGSLSIDHLIEGSSQHIAGQSRPW